MVKNLLTFIKNGRSCQGGLSSVFITKEISDFKKKHSNANPILLVDFKAFLSVFNEHSKEEVLCAGREKLCTQRAENFIKQLYDLGTELIFFLDGPIKNEKIPYYKKNCDNSYDEMTNYFKPEKKTIDSNKVPKHYAGVLTPIYYDSILEIARKYGQIRISLQNECDLDLAELAFKNPHVLAVVASDTDFVIMEGDYQIWLPYTIDCKSLTANCITKEAVRLNLNLSQKQMAIFATLSGNTIVLHNMVQNHIRGIRYHDQPFEISKIVQTNFPNGIENESDINKLTELVWQETDSHLSRVEIKDLVKKSLNSYNVTNVEHGEVQIGWLQNHIKATNSTVIFTTLNDVLFTFNTYYIYLNMPNTAIYSEKMLTIILRQMGYILRAHNKVPKTRNIFYKANHDSAYKTIAHDLIYPDFRVLPLESVVECGQDIASSVNIKQKFYILSWLISPVKHNLNPEILQKLSTTSFFMPIMILNFCVKEGLLSVLEADIMLLSIMKTKKLSTDELENFAKPQKNNILTRAVYICHVYTISIYFFINALAISGLHYLYKPGYFDGYVFHEMYANILELDLEEQQKCVNTIDDTLRIYKN